MFTQKIIDSDPFLDMPLSTQALYFHLNMRADDDGFINNPKRIQRTIGASEDDLKLLIAKRFVIGFECGVIVIKHWRMHNTLRKDRYNPTQYQDELAMLEVKDNNAYTERLPEVQQIPELPAPAPVATTWQPNGNQTVPQYSIDKNSIDKVSKEKNSTTQPSKADVDAFFESIWELYPVKKGKGQVSDTKRKALFKIGYERMEQAINRYLTELKKDASWRKPQNGSTFFNSGYVDYLDENYAPDQTVYGGRKEKLPEWFGKRELDDDEKFAIQRMLNEPIELGVAEHAAIQRILNEPDEDFEAEAEQLRRELQAAYG
jgi:hypothetical protein